MLTGLHTVDQFWNGFELLRKTSWTKAISNASVGIAYSPEPSAGQCQTAPPPPKQGVPM
jgi:hypothetical protein